MSTLAKVFSVIVLVLSIFFLTSLAALYHHRVDWRTQFEKLQAKYKELKDLSLAQMSYLKNVIEAKDRKVDEMVEREKRLVQFVNELKRRYRDAATSLAIETQEMALLLRQHALIVEILSRKDDRIRELERQRDILQREYTESVRQKDTAEKQAVRLGRALLYYEKSVRDLRTELARVRRQLDEKCLVIERLNMLGVPVYDLIAQTPAPPIDGVVAAVDEATQLVVLNVGVDQGVRVGYRFTIYRGNQFVAVAVIEKVWAGASGGRVLFAVGKIQAGDRATTWLP